MRRRRLLRRIWRRLNAWRRQPLDVAITRHLRPDHRRVFWGDRLLTLDKAAGFLEDPKFAAAFAAIKGSHAYDQYESPDTISWRLHTLTWAAQNAMRLSGDFVECGVFKGDMAWFVMTMMGEAFRERTFYLYDSFAGFSPALSSDADFPDDAKFYDFANRVYQAEGLEASVRARFAPHPNVRITTGFLPGAFDQGCPEKIAFLHMDLNSAAAEVASLELLFDRVVPGGVIVFDDYGWDLFRRQKSAEDAFFAARGYVVMELPTGQGLVVKRP
jgi:O-methyltransferase